METRVYSDLQIHGSVIFAKNESELPISPTVGQIVLMDGRLYVYTKISDTLFSWLPVGVKSSVYVHSQGTSTVTWTIPHNLGTSDYGLFVYDTDHRVVSCNHVALSNNIVQVSLSAPTAGTAIVFGVTDFASTSLTTSSITIGDVTLDGSEAGIINLIGGTIEGMSGGVGPTGPTGPTSYDADTVDGKHVGTSGDSIPTLSAANTWSGVQTFENGVFENKVELLNGEIDLTLGGIYTITVSSAVTFSTINVPLAGTMAAFLIEIVNGGSAQIIWPTGSKWVNGTPPSLSSSGRDLLGFLTYDGGSTWLAFVVGKDIK